MNSPNTSKNLSGDSCQILRRQRWSEDKIAIIHERDCGQDDSCCKRSAITPTSHFRLWSRRDRDNFGDPGQSLGACSGLLVDASSHRDCFLVPPLVANQAAAVHKPLTAAAVVTRVGLLTGVRTPHVNRSIIRPGKAFVALIAGVRLL
jgi:hypothetical protein